jgi:hypothetical protein
MKNVIVEAQRPDSVNVPIGTRSVEQLQRSVEQLQTALFEAQSKHRDDIELIGNAMIDEAVARDWCSNYDEFVDRLNEMLHVALPLRERKYRMTVTAEIVFTSDPDDVDSNSYEIANSLEASDGEIESVVVDDVFGL